MKEACENWYALKIFYNKLFDMEKRLADEGIPSYMAVKKVRLKGMDHFAAQRFLARLEQEHRTDSRFVTEGPVIYKRVPMVSSILFIHTPEENLHQVETMLRDPDNLLRPKGFIYKTTDWKEYAVIPQKQMDIFRMVTESGVSGLDFYADDELTRYKQGDKVRVKDGPLKGAEGYIKRIKKDRRLLVCIEGIIAVATSYIPPEQLEIVKEE